MYHFCNAGAEGQIALRLLKDLAVAGEKVTAGEISKGLELRLCSLFTAVLAVCKTSRQ